jgi:PAS domain S-box-containing protein
VFAALKKAEELSAARIAAVGQRVAAAGRVLPALSQLEDALAGHGDVSALTDIHRPAALGAALLSEAARAATADEVQVLRRGFDAEAGTLAAPAATPAPRPKSAESAAAMSHTERTACVSTAIACSSRSLRMKSHNESMLRSLTNGVLTIDMRGEVTFVNQAALATLRRGEAELLGQPIMKVFGEMNAWLLEAIDEVANGRAEKQLPNSEFYIESVGEWVSVNISLLPLLDARKNPLGFMLVMENLERERELRRTMSRYLSNEVIDRLMQDSGATLGGSAQIATTLFSDIRGFTSLSESLGAPGTVSMLNEYFSYMEDVLTNRSGIIDKYIGDAIMAVFGLPFPNDDDVGNAVQAACDMLQVVALLNTRRPAAPSASASASPPVRSSPATSARPSAWISPSSAIP